MNPLVSIVVPVYNTERFLVQCMDSIVNQSLKNIEIICVNDGSTDGSLDILNRYERQDNRVHVITIKNQGGGVARNEGMHLAQGEYITFLDSDDFFEPCFIEELYKKAKKDSLDVAVCRCDQYDNSTGNYIPADFSIRKDLLPKKEIFNIRDVEKDFFHLFVWWPWDKLYRREFIAKHQLQFQALRSTDDLFFVCTAVLLAERVGVSEDVWVHHRINNPASVSNTREKSFDDFLTALHAIRDSLKINNLFNDLKRDFINYVWAFSLWHLDTLKGTPYIKLYNKIRDYIIPEFQVDNIYEILGFYHQWMENRYQEIIETDVTTYLVNERDRIREEFIQTKADLDRTKADLDRTKAEKDQLRKFNISRYFRTKIFSKIALGSFHRKFKEQYEEQKRLYRQIRKGI